MATNQFSISEDLFDGYSENQNAKTEYENSEDFSKDAQLENFREEFSPIATEETKKFAEDDDSGIIGSTINFGKHVGIGAAKGVEEVGQTLRLLDDNAFNLPEPKTTAESLAQGFGQFLPLFIPATGAIGAGVRLAGLVGKTKKAKVGIDFLVGTAAGAVSDAASFDPKDPNVANFLLVSGAISDDSRAGAAVKSLLAQDDTDTEGTARLKSAASGVIAGAVLTGIFKGAGIGVSKLRGKKGLPDSLDGVPIKDIEAKIKPEVDAYVDGVLESKKNLKGDQMSLFGDDLPSIEGAAKDTVEKEVNNFSRPWDSLTPEKRKEAEGIVRGWAETGSVDSVDLKTIESMNFLKLKTPQDVRNVLQFLSEKMDVKKLVKGRIKTKDFDTASGAREMLELPEAEFARILAEQSGNVRGAIRFVGAARALSAAAIKKAEDGFQAFAKSGDEAIYQEALTSTKLATDMLFAGGELSKASSDLLRSHQKIINGIDSLTDIKFMLNNTVIKNDPQLSIKQAGWFATNRNIDQLKVRAKFPGGVTKVSTIDKIVGETAEQTQKRAVQVARKGELADIARANRKQTVSRANSMNKSFKARTRDAMLEIYVNGLLSSVKTFEINLLGNTSAIASSVIDRAYAGFVKRGGAVTGQEAATLAKSYWNSVSSLRDFWALMRQSWSLTPTTNIKQDFIRPHDKTLSSAGLQIGGNLGRAIDVFGTVVNFPGRILLSADEVFKTINYRAETRALAYRKAFREIGEAGGTVKDKVEINNRFNEIIQDLDAHEDITEAAKGFSAKNTFTNPLQSHTVKQADGSEKVVPGLGLRLKGVLDADQTGIARVFIPFFQTPANLLNFAWERTPLIRKLNKGLQAELAADAPQAVRELAQAKIATSRMMWATTIGLATTGEFTGGPPQDPNLRKNLEAAMGGRHWYSYRTKNGWKQYDKFDPIGVVMAASANGVVMAKASMNLAGLKESDDPSGEIHAKYLESLEAGTVGMLRLMTDRHYLQGFSEMVNVFSGEGSMLSKVRKGGEKVLVAANPLTSFYSSFRRNITAGLEPEKLTKLQRTELNDLEDVGKEIGIIFEEAMRSITPGYGTKVPAKNLAGETVLFPGTNHEIDTQPFEVLSNLATTSFNPNAPLTPSKSPLIHKIAQLEMSVGQPSGVNKLNGVLLSDEEKSFFVDSWTDMNKSLDKVVSSKNFNKFPEGFQRDFIDTMIQSNKRLASKATSGKFPRLLRSSFDLKKQSLHSDTLKQVPTNFQTN